MGFIIFNKMFYLTKFLSVDVCVALFDLTYKLHLN